MGGECWDIGAGLAGHAESDRGLQEAQGSPASLAGGLALSVCAMPSGARSLYAIAQWGREKLDLAQSLGFSREQTPCVATLHHVFLRLDVDAFEEVLCRWAQECLGDEEAAIAIVGKLCGGFTGRNCREYGRWRHMPGKVAWGWGKRGVEGSWQGE